MIRKIDDIIFSDIADAIREKNGETTTYKPAEMPAAIIAIEGGGGGGDLPEEALTVTGGCNYRFANDGWNWFIKEYGDKIKTENITDMTNMFSGCLTLEEIPFDFNFKITNSVPAMNVFQNCKKLKVIGKFVNFKPASFQSVFNSCYVLRYLPEFENCDFSTLNNSTSGGAHSGFYYCYSLREIPTSLLKQIKNKSTSTYVASYYNTFAHCQSLDELNGVAISEATFTSNAFSSTFSNITRAKNIIFDTNDDGTVKTANWKSQLIDLTYSVGYASSTTNILNYNSGITADKRVTDDATYAALKTDLDWFTTDINYSRYNHDSAVNTINSLPDTSAYLATAGGTNTIKFKGAAGAKTDGGAINTLTEEEIAVATAKGWTVTLA